MYGIGLLGVLMRRFDFPTAPVIVGMILGPLAEAQMRNALSIGEGPLERLRRAADVGHAAGGGGRGAGAAARRPPRVPALQVRSARPASASIQSGRRSGRGCS
jgi:hypothetical protein